MTVSVCYYVELRSYLSIRSMGEIILPDNSIGRIVSKLSKNTFAWFSTKNLTIVVKYKKKIFFNSYSGSCLFVQGAQTTRSVSGNDIIFMLSSLIKYTVDIYKVCFQAENGALFIGTNISLTSFLR